MVTLPGAIRQGREVVKLEVTGQRYAIGKIWQMSQNVTNVWWTKEKGRWNGPRNHQSTKICLTRNASASKKEAQSATSASVKLINQPIILNWSSTYYLELINQLTYYLDCKNASICGISSTATTRLEQLWLPGLWRLYWGKRNYLKQLSVIAALSTSVGVVVLLIGLLFGTDLRRASISS